MKQVVEKDLKNKVVNMVVTLKTVTLYFSDGSFKELNNTLKSTKDTIKDIQNQLANGNVAVYNENKGSINIYKPFQEKTGGLLKFFRVAKSAIFGKEDLKYDMISSIMLPIEDNTEVDERDTIVAVISDPKKKDETPDVVKGIENLNNYIADSSINTERHESVVAFIKRLNNLGKKRKHSADELLSFIKKADLPLTNTGDIVAYKRLCKRPADGEFPEHYVDSHSGKVRQMLLGTVSIDEDLVDPDRRNECSTGLHIGRRDYMSSFYGDTIVIVIIRPEDVIAVPKDYSGSKMRCSRYTIVHEVTQLGFIRLTTNKPVTDSKEDAIALAHIINGNYGEIIHSTHESADKKYTFNFAIKKSEPVSQKGAEPITPIKDISNSTKEKDPLTEEDILSISKSKEGTKKKKATALTSDQKKAKKNWDKIKDGSMTKAALARECNTSTRSLDRWAVKFNW